MPQPKKCVRRPGREKPFVQGPISYHAPGQSAALEFREEPAPCPAQPLGAVEHHFSENIRAGKNTYVYDAHTYHTKVPPEGIAKLIEYYTAPGQVVLDPFCGSGMTGVAAGNLGRKALLSDLSPAATFIARHLNTPVDAGAYLKAVRSILQDAAGLEAKLYNTPCRNCGTLTPMLYTVWSYGVVCPGCEREFMLWDVARDEKPSVRESKILSEFACPCCKTHLKKRGLKRTRRHPVQVGYKCCARGLKEQTASLCDHDHRTLADIQTEGIPPTLWYPKDRFPEGINTRQPIAAGIERVDQAYTTRALYAMAWLWHRAQQWPDPQIAGKLLFTLTSLYQRVTVFSEFRFWGGSGNTANYNVPFISNEQNVFRAFQRKANTISWYFRAAPKRVRDVDVRKASACSLLHVPDRSVDYVFTDPPFGGNINYSEMNFLWESWLKDHTDTREEAIINAVQGKGCAEYSGLLARAFRECRRVLKDAGWMTVMFHNSSGEVWTALRAAISDAGFAVRGTQTFDKEHGTFKQFVSDNAVGYDLILHCRKADHTHATKKNGTASSCKIAEFVRLRVAQDPERYRVHFLHVRRTDAWDFRKLHAEWLAEALPENSGLLGFEEFRNQAQSAVADVKLTPFQHTLL
ncbi:MAG: DNA methyltransferase [Verrucomicrobiota bacterium]|jgi:16S rRNA G966 N2-methylase RsmD